MTTKNVNPLLKLALDIGPLGVFFVAFRYGRELLEIPAIYGFLEPATGAAALAGASGPLFVATAFFMAAIAASLTLSWCLLRHLPRMAVVTGIVVAIFGGLTLWLQDETFIKMKPTMVNAIFALILGFGLVRGRSYLKSLIGEMMSLDDAGWMIFTRRWVMFFLFMAVLNEVVWRSQTTENWVAYKTFGSLPLTFVFLALQWPLLKRHMVEGG
ncbi:MAG: septation protein A [Proteobacteria bacterium]|nr:septation protein A [Pseudomonadota bacterium]